MLVSEIATFSPIESGLVIVMRRKTKVHDILAGSTPNLCCLDEFIRLIGLYLQSAAHASKHAMLFIRFMVFF